MADGSMLTIGVVIPTRNRPALLANAIESVQTQTYQCEIVVVDEASSPPADVPDGVQLLRHESPRGPAAARNAGAALLSTDLVAFLDDDDRWQPTKAERCVDALESDLEAVAVFHRAAFTPQVPDRGTTCGSSRIDEPRRRFLHAQPPHPDCLVVRSWAHDAVRYDETYPAAADLDYALRIAQLGPVAFIDEVLAVHRPEGAVLSDVALENRIAGRTRFREQHAALFDRRADAYHYQRLGQLHLRAGNRRAAIGHFLRALATRPGNGPVAGLLRASGVDPSWLTRRTRSKDAPPRVAMLPGPKLAENPYVSELARHLELPVDAFGVRSVSRGDAVLVHWPQMYAKSVARLMLYIGLLAVARTRRIPVVWVAHNLEPHTGGPAARLSYRSTVALCTHIVCLTAGSVERVRAKHRLARHRPTTVIPLPRYPVEFTGDRLGARARLGIAPEAFVVVMFGSMRANKLPRETVRWFREQAGCDDVLLIAGRASDAAIRADLERSAEEDARIRTRLEYVSDQELSQVLTAADVAACFFAEGVENSSTVVHALCHGRPVVTTAVGAVADLGKAESDWVLAVEAGILPVLEEVRAYVASDRSDPPSFPEPEAVAQQFRTLLIFGAGRHV